MSLFSSNCHHDTNSIRKCLSIVSVFVIRNQIEDEEESKLNPGECDIVMKQVQTLIDAGLEQDDIGVITPYNGQVYSLGFSFFSSKLKFNLL